MSHRFGWAHEVSAGGAGFTRIVPGSADYARAGARTERVGVPSICARVRVQVAA
jgi:hypothetical protein